MNYTSRYFVFVVAISSWCAPTNASETREADCRQFYQQVDRTIAHAGVRDAQDAAVKGYPYLRGNRFLASIAKDADSDERFDFLLQQLRILEDKARALELKNSPASTLMELSNSQRASLPGQTDLAATLKECADILFKADRGRRDDIRRDIAAPAHYSLLKRVLGFYPITAIPFSRGIRKFQSEMTQAYAKNLSEVVRDGSVVFHVPSAVDPVDATAILHDASDNPLRIPLPSPAQLAQLFAQFAPIFAIDTRGEFDRPGAVRWDANGQPEIDAASAQIYTLASHTLFLGQSLLQLNYVIWFSERPKNGKFDMLGGDLDGLIWRVTLAPDGQPLLYDTIHPCGCYHLFFPTQKLRAKPPHPSLQETAYVPQPAPRLNSGEHPTLWIESATHYIVRVTNTPLDTTKSALPYALTDYDQLRSLPLASGANRSLFRPDGLIEGTERGERLFFWPMGIASAGAMRQWGHHATAFVGMRHFDDADLIDKAFEANP
jgi:hypothetical protein